LPWLALLTEAAIPSSSQGMKEANWCTYPTLQFHTHPPHRPSAPQVQGLQLQNIIHLPVVFLGRVSGYDDPSSLQRHPALCIFTPGWAWQYKGVNLASLHLHPHICWATNRCRAAGREQGEDTERAMGAGKLLFPCCIFLGALNEEWLSEPLCPQCHPRKRGTPLRRQEDSVPSCCAAGTQHVPASGLL